MNYREGKPPHAYANGRSRALTVAWVLLACAVGFISEATAESPTPSIITPRSAHDLLVNLGTALESDLLLSDTFYTDANLIRFFGTHEVQWLRNEPQEKRVVLRNVTYLQALEGPKPQIAIVSSLGEKPERMGVERFPRASISISCACMLRVEDLDAALASASRTVKDQPRRTHDHYPVPPRASDPMGNKLAFYEIPTLPGLVSSVRAVFDPAGNITSVEAIQRKQP